MGWGYSGYRTMVPIAWRASTAQCGTHVRLLAYFADLAFLHFQTQNFPRLTFGKHLEWTAVHTGSRLLPSMFQIHFRPSQPLQFFRRNLIRLDCRALPSRRYERNKTITGLPSPTGPCYSGQP